MKQSFILCCLLALGLGVQSAEVQITDNGPKTSYHYFEDKSGFEFVFVGSEVWVVGVKEGFSLKNLTIPKKVTDVYVRYKTPYMVGYPQPVDTIRTVYDVVGIGSNVYSGHKELTAVVIPSHIKKIGSLFDGCTNLKSVTINGPIESIPAYFIRGCEKLASFTIPSTVTTIADYAFCDATGLKSITIPAGITKIGPYTFSGCSSLETVKLPNSLESIGTWAFKDCTSLKSIKLPSSVTELGEWAFYGCTSLKDVQLPSGLTAIQPYTFGDCSSLDEIKFPKSLTTIYKYGFNGAGLVNLTIPSTLLSIGDGAFSECRRLKNVIIEDRDLSLDIGTNTKTSGMFSESPLDSVYIGGNLTLTHVKKSSSLEQIPTGSYAAPFRNNTSLRTLVIGGKATEILNREYERCGGLQRVELSGGINTIGYRSFYSCASLKAVVVSWKEPVEDKKSDTGDKGMFYVEDVYDKETGGWKYARGGSDDVYDNATLYVKGVSTVPYKSVAPWKYFKNIKYIRNTDDPIVMGDANGDNKVTIFDAVQVVNYILGKNPASFDSGAADVNGDGKITIFDAVQIVNIIFGK